MIAMGLNDKTGLLSAQLIVHDDEDILLITDDGTIIRTPVSEIRVCGRSSQGVRLMRIAAGSRIISVCRADHVEEQKEDGSAAPAPSGLLSEEETETLPGGLNDPADTDDTAGAGGDASSQPDDEL
jgi:DNA gyrase subunit A